MPLVNCNMLSVVKEEDARIIYQYMASPNLSRVALKIGSQLSSFATSCLVPAYGLYGLLATLLIPIGDDHLGSFLHEQLCS